MKLMEKNVMRLVAVQHLRTAFGIKTKYWNKIKTANSKTRTNNSKKVFGVSLESLPYYNMECGSVPSFLVDACMKLLAHIDTEGLFRKSGSVSRLKDLRAKLDVGEECLSTALPCDVAGLVKQFFRELPEPVLPKELQEAFLKARQLPAEEDRTSATILLTCVLPDKNRTILHYFFDFLHNVSKRCSENKMDSNNLSVIFAPNLLHFGDGTEKMTANTEKYLKLQAAIIHCLIENAHSFGVLPHFLQEKVPAMMGCEPGDLSPTHDAPEEDLTSGMKRRQRRSLGVFSSATPVIATPSSKRKDFPLDSGHSFGFSNKKRRSVKKTLGIDLLPNTLFSGISTPGSVHSASGVLDSSNNTLSSAGRLRKHPATSGRRKSQRLSNRHAVNRVESGRAGCFSPKASHKEAPRKSLRLRFSLGKSSKDAGSESIGWRLASQESTTAFCFTKEAEFSPSVLPGKTGSKGSNYMSKSEDNLLTPQCDSRKTSKGAQAFNQASFSDTPMSTNLKNSYVSEPTIVVSKPPAAASLHKKLCCASSAESLDSERSVTEAQSQTGPTLLKVKAFAESSINLQAVMQDPCNSMGVVTTKPASHPVPPPETPIAKVKNMDIEASTPPAQQFFPADSQNITFSQFEIAALSPLHIDSEIFETGVYCSPPKTGIEGSPCTADLGRLGSSMVEESGRQVEQFNRRRLIDTLDIQTPVVFKLGISSGLQSTPYKLDLELEDKLGSTSVVHEKKKCSPDISSKIPNQQPPSRQSPRTEKHHVADHIQHFNKLTLCPPKGSAAAQIRSPLKFQRTPVRQTVRRINSILTDSKRPSRNAKAITSQRNEAESSLSSHPQPEPHQGVSKSQCPKKKPPPVPPKTASTLSRKPKTSALGDVTNTVQLKTKLDACVPDQPGMQKVVQQMAEKEMNYYRGSPRNPLHQGRLLSATRPVDL
ncbi:rho GTPase-activating protein 11A [Antennarius striatus]|uniref:rho GTPase-activating protein 11A n=1 Tax=Antennarius striatus TaxID=241820 RepID=UPI0035B48719